MEVEGWFIWTGLEAVNFTKGGEEALKIDPFYKSFISSFYKERKRTNEKTQTVYHSHIVIHQLLWF